MKTADKWSSIEVLRENPKEFCVYTKPAVLSKTKTFFYVKFAATQTKANIFAKNNFHQTL